MMQSEAGGVLGTASRVAVEFTVVDRMRRNGTFNVHAVWSRYGHSASPTQGTIALARQILSGAIADPTDGATYFYTPDIMPKKGGRLHGDTGGGLENAPGVFRQGTVQTVQDYRPAWVNNFIKSQSRAYRKDYSSSTSSLKWQPFPSIHHQFIHDLFCVSAVIYRVCLAIDLRICGI